MNGGTVEGAAILMGNFEPSLVLIALVDPYIVKPCDQTTILSLYINNHLASSIIQMSRTTYHC